MALDGGVTGMNEHKANNKAVATVVIMILDENKEGKRDITKEEMWQQARPIPIYSRTCRLPQQLGQEDTTSTSAELRAANMAMEIIPESIAAITIMDSSTARGIVRDIRDNRTKHARRILRNVFSGGGKGEAERVSRNQKDIENWLSSGGGKKGKEMRGRMTDLIHLTKKWTSENEEGN